MDSAKQEKSVLVLSAHADDHIACAGTLFKLRDQGYKIYEIVLTDSSEGRDKRLEGGDYDVAELRDQELSKASEFLGIQDTYRLLQEDMGLTYSKDLVFKIVEIIRQLKPNIGIMHNEYDRHPDHRAAFQLGSEAFKNSATGIKPELGDHWKTSMVLCAEGMLPVIPDVLVDVTKYMPDKMKLWRIYESQANPQAINFEESLTYVRGNNLRRPGSMLAEAFTTDKTAPIILFDND